MFRSVCILTMLAGLNICSIMATEEMIFSDTFKNKSAKEWLLDTGDSSGLGYSFGNDGSLILSIKNEGCRSFSLKMPLPVQHRISFELYEMPGENPLRWDVRFTNGLSRFDGLPFVNYQLERNGGLEFWTRSEQGWISGLPGTPGLGLRDLIHRVKSGNWYKVVIQNDDVSTLLKIYELSEDREVYESQMSHDKNTLSGGSISFNLYNYENRKEPLELKIRNVRIFSTNSKIPKQSRESAKK